MSFYQELIIKIESVVHTFSEGWFERSWVCVKELLVWNLFTYYSWCFLLAYLKREKKA